MSFMTDVFPDGCHYHSWRVALLAEHLASQAAPDIQRDIFFAGLLQEIGSVGAVAHITQLPGIAEQLRDSHVASHPERGAALLSWLPGMAAAASMVRSHHERWDGGGYPDHLADKDIPIGAQILHLADAVDLAGSFRHRTTLKPSLQALAPSTGVAWSADMWAALVSSLEDAAFYRSLMTEGSLSEMVSDRLRTLGIPPELDTDEGVERTLHIFAALVDIKDPSNAGHSRRTASYAHSLAESMGLSESDVLSAYRAGLVHDCGRIGLPTQLANKTGRLNDRELKLVRRHAEMTIRAFGCLADYPHMAALGNLAGHDHERFDGAGYPDGLAGDAIPMVSRILSAVDAFDAMTSASSYRLLSPRCAVVRLQQGAGTQFDPEVVEAIVASVGGGAFGERFGTAA